MTEFKEHTVQYDDKVDFHYRFGRKYEYEGQVYFVRDRVSSGEDVNSPVYLNSEYAVLGACCRSWHRIDAGWHFADIQPYVSEGK